MRRTPDFIDECYKDKDLALLKKLTLVIPTYNRNYYLSRCLWYHAHFPFDQIIVADSSHNDKKIENRKIIAKIKETFDANVAYFEYSPEKEKYGDDVYLKWRSAILNVKSKYTKLCTDKEFIIPDTVCSSIQFLEDYPNYNTASGKFMQIYCGCELNKKPTKWVLTNRFDKSYEDDSPIMRVRDAFQNFRQYKGAGAWNFLTAVRRTEFQKHIYNELMKYSLIDIRFGDMVPQLLSILCSKRKLLNNVEVVRDLSFLTAIDGSKNHLESSYSRYPTIYDMKKEKILHGKMCALKKCISNELSHSGVTDKLSVDKYSSEIISNYLNLFGLKNNSKYTRSFTGWGLLLLSQLPPNIQNIIRYNSGFFAESELSSSDDIINTEYKKLNIIESIIALTTSYHSQDESIDFGILLDMTGVNTAESGEVHSTTTGYFYSTKSEEK